MKIKVGMDGPWYHIVSDVFIFIDVTVAAPVAVLPVAHVDEVHLVVLRPHDVAHGPTQRSPRLHAAQPPVPDTHADQLRARRHAVLLGGVGKISYLTVWIK